MNIAIIAPHPDDAELAMGAALALFARQGHAVTIVDVTNGEPTPFGTPETRAAEAAAAARILGVSRLLVGLKNREVTHDLPSRHALAAVYRRLRPDLLFIPFPHDAHPDHLAVSRLAADARFDAKLTKSPIPGEPFYPRRLFHYFCTHLHFNFPAAFCLDVTATYETKEQALRCYQSQFFTGRPPAEQGAVIEYVRNIARYFGGTISRPFAEPFSSPESLGLSSLDALTLP